jgi:glycosyl transferase family 87
LSRRQLGYLGLAGLIATAVPLAAPGTTTLVPAATDNGPGWLRGVYGDGLGVSAGAYYALLWVAFASYIGVVWGAGALDGRVLWGAIAALVAGFALAPPLLSQDVFSYISYARLGAEHGLNPYVHVPSDAPTDPALIYANFSDRTTVYGPLFTLATYPLGLGGVALALWSLKAAAAASVFGLAALCARIAPARGVAPARAAALVALNPLVLVHVVGGGHNDGVMMLLVTLGVAGVLAGADTRAGVALAAAAAIKVSAAFVAPFALLGSQQRARLIAGLVLGLAAIAAVALPAFGLHALDPVGLARENQGTLNHYSLPSTLARSTGIDASSIRTAALVAYAVLVLYLLRWTWRGGDWLRAAAWAGIGLLVASGVLWPWYLLWALPLVALVDDLLLIAAVLALTAFQLNAGVPL